MKTSIYSILNRFVVGWYDARKISFIIVLLISQQVFSQAPSITSFSPTSAATGNTVVITGANFSGATAVSFGGTPAASFNVVSSTQINAVVAGGTSGTVMVSKDALSGTKTGFYYLTLSGIITDFAGYWPSTTVSNNPVNPDDAHNLLAFTFNGVTYSTGVNNGILTGQGINYTAGNFKSLPVADIAGTNSSSSIYLAMASKVDGTAAVANAAAVANLTIKDVMTDGGNGLNMGTGITNLPISAIMTFDIHIINPTKILDAEPDILITQIADPSSGNDVFQFVNAAGVTVGNPITQDMTLLTKLGTYNLDLFNLSPGAPFNSATGFSSSSTNTTRNIRLIGFKLSDFGITTSNYTEIAAIKITPSGTSDYAFIAFNANAIEMAPNIGQNVEKTNRAICSGGTANLEVIASAAYGGNLTYSWEQSLNNGVTWTAVVDGAGITGATTKRLSIVSPGNGYQYRATVTESGTGYTSVTDPFIISVITPTAPTAVSVASSATTCLNSLVSLSSTVTGGSNLFYQWQTNASGSYIDIPGAILKTYQPPVNATGLVSYKLRVSSGSGCSGSVTSSAATITVAGISSVSPASRCGTGTVLLGAVATSGNISWYAESTGGSAISTGVSYSPSISATTTYYVNTDASACVSASRVPVLATINTITWAGTNTTAWSSLANWDCGGVAPSVLPSPSNNITIPAVPSGGRFPVISDTATINDITISSGASITVATSGNFEIYGSIYNNGSFIASSGTVSMRGIAQQTIPANAFSTNTIRNLVINNASGVLLGGTLNITGTLTPTAGTLTTFGYLTLRSDSAGTARVAAGSSNYIIGNVNVERYMPARRAWRLMTAPLTNSNTIYQSWQNGGVYVPGKGMLVSAPGGGIGIDSAGNASMKTWNVTSQVLQTVNNTKVPVSGRSTGSADNTAYFVFVRGDRDLQNIDPNAIKKNITTLTSTGYLQTGTQRFTGLSSVAGGFSLIGNPYAAPIDFNQALANSGTTNIKRKFYVWDPQLNSVGGYVAMDDVVTPGVFLPSPANSSQQNNIQSGQAFFVITNTAGAAALEVKETNKSSTSNTLIFGRPMGATATVISNLYLLNADGSITTADGARADFNSDFSAGIDDKDNIKCTNTNETFGFLRNGTFLATERRPAITVRDTLFFKLVQASRRSYQLQFISSGFTDASLIAVLEDSYTKAATQLDLDGTSIINFVINTDAASAVSNRFRIVFSKISLLPVSFTTVQAVYQRGKVMVNWKVENEMNINSYVVEKSADGISFSQAATLDAKGQNLATVAYGWTDNRVTDGNIFYRIKSIGIDGSVQYSRVMRVTIDGKQPGMYVYPNPVTGKTIHLVLNNQAAGLLNIELAGNNGQLLVKKSINYRPGIDDQIAIPLPAGLQKGQYQLLVSGKNLKQTTLTVFIE